MSGRQDPTEREIEDIVRKHLRVRKRVVEANGPHVIADCLTVSCPNPKEHLYLNTVTGLWNCVRCESAGNLWTLADLLGIRVRERSIVVTAASVLMQGISDRARQDRRTRDAPKMDLGRAEQQCAKLFGDDAAGQAVRTYLHRRGLDDETIKRFSLGLASINGETMVGIPYIEDGKVPLVKMRNLEDDKSRRKFFRTKGGHSGLFNVESIRGLRQVVLVEGEIDAISLWQMGITNVASTSLGAKKTIPAEWVEDLADADDIVLWYDDDERGDDAATGLLMQLGSHRCRVARMDVQAPDGRHCKDANDLLRSMGDGAAAIARKIVADAKRITNARVITPDSFNDRLLSEINKGEASLGVSSGYRDLDRLLRGIRLQELTLVTGHTGHGKTTAVLSILQNLARAGHPAMAAGIENGPLALARKIFQHKYGRPISAIKSDEDRTKAEDVLRRMNEDPLYLLDLYGRKPLDEILDAFVAARYQHNVRYFGLDHLHFIGRRDPRADRLDHLDETIGTCVEWVRKHDAHLFLLAHTRGDIPQDMIPSGDTIKGTSSAKQDADNGLTIYRQVNFSGGADNGKKMKIKDSLGRKVEIDLGSRDVLVQVWKTRLDEASEGSTVWAFDRGSLTYNPKDATAAGAAEDVQDGNDHEQGDLTFDPWHWSDGVPAKTPEPDDR